MSWGTSWYAVMTHPRAEEAVEERLKAAGYETFYPHCLEPAGKRGRYRERMVKRPYYSRYLFVGLGPQHHCGNSPNLYPVNEMNGVSSVVYAPGGLAFPMPELVMADLMGRCDSHGEVYETRLRKRTFSGKRGERVVLGETSPYWNFICEIQSVDDDDKIIVLLETFGRKVPTLIRKEDIHEWITKGGETISKDDPRMCKLA